MRFKVSMIALVASALGLGCGDDDSVAMDGGPDTDAMAPMDGGPTDSGPRPDMPSADDDNDTFATADPVTLDDAVEGAILNPPGDLDYYSFEGEADQWISISTIANPDDDPEMVDTVITLFDSTMTQIAENDDRIPRRDTDSEILTRLPGAGTYYVLVQEFSTWAGETDEGMESFSYELSIIAIDPDVVAVTVDPETGDDVASAQNIGLAVQSGGDSGILLGDLRDGSDVDVYSFTATAARPYPQFLVLPSGPEGMGATITPSAVWVTNADGDVIIGRVDPSMLAELSPGLPEGQYRLWVEHGGTPGANDFYVIKAFRLPSDNPPEMDDALNDVAATAEALTLADDDGDGVSTGFVLAMVEDGDTDHFSVEAAEGDVISVFCGSRSAGSGVIGLEAAVTDATGVTVLESGTEDPIDGLVLEEVATSGAGTYLVRLTKASQDPVVVGTWVRCGVAVGPPAAP